MELRKLPNAACIGYGHERSNGSFSPTHSRPTWETKAQRTEAPHGQPEGAALHDCWSSALCTTPGLPNQHVHKHAQTHTRTYTHLQAFTLTRAYTNTRLSNKGLKMGTSSSLSPKIGRREQACVRSSQPIRGFLDDACISKRVDRERCGLYSSGGCPKQVMFSLSEVHSAVAGSWRPSQSCLPIPLLGGRGFCPFSVTMGWISCSMKGALCAGRVSSGVQKVQSQGRGTVSSKHARRG